MTLTTRSKKLRSHPGETALPGGRWEEGDGEGGVWTAVRGASSLSEAKGEADFRVRSTAEGSKRRDWSPPPSSLFRPFLPLNLPILLLVVDRRDAPTPPLPHHPPSLHIPHTSRRPPRRVPLARTALERGQVVG